MYERGRIRNQRWGSQIIDFSGLRFGNITPTDIDGFIDFGNRLFIYLEYKYGDAEMPAGQRLALERQVDALQQSGKEACVLVGSHRDEGEIDGANARLVKYRYNGRWCVPPREMTIRQAIDHIVRRKQTYK